MRAIAVVLQLVRHVLQIHERIIDGIDLNFWVCLLGGNGARVGLVNAVMLQLVGQAGLVHEGIFDGQSQEMEDTLILSAGPHMLTHFVPVILWGEKN